MPNPQQIARASVPKYLHYSPAIPEMIALGRNAPIIIANQLVINDRLQPDRYIVKDITGLRGPDLRDSRQPRPAAHGEVLFDSYWGGKTVTVAGTMEAGSIAQLNGMERDLVACLGSPPQIGLATSQTQAALEVFAALQSMTEFPIKFNWWDQHDAFFDTTSVAYWSQLSGAALSIPGTGRLTSVGGGASVSYHSLRSGFIDEVVTGCVSVQPGVGTNSIGVVLCATASNSYLEATLNLSGTTWSLSISAVQPSGTTQLASANLGPNPTIASTLWIQMQTLDDLVTATVFSQDPNVVQSPTVLATCSYTFTGALAQQFGFGQPGFVGLTSTLLDGRWCFLDWRVDAIYPSDFMLSARTVQSPAMSHTATNDLGTRFKRDFQFAVRCSDPRILGPVRLTSSVPLSSGAGVYFGRTYPRFYPTAYKIPTSLPTNAPLTQPVGLSEQAVIRNRGTWVAYPLVTIYGGITNPTLYNLTSGYNFSLDGTIASGDYVVIDSFNKVMTNKSGASVMSMFDTGNIQWPEISPGDNTLQLVGSNPVGSPLATLSYSYAWI
jgi:hypothetical protein